MYFSFLIFFFFFFEKLIITLFLKYNGCNKFVDNLNLFHGKIIEKNDKQNIDRKNYCVSLTEEAH